MQPTTTRSSRSSIIYPITPLTSAYVQQPQRIVYTPVTTIPTNNRSLQPNHSYSRNQKSVCQIAPVQGEVKINVWPIKNKVIKNQQYCQPRFVHPSNPVVFFKQQPINTLYSQNQANTSFLVSSSNLPANPYTEEHYNRTIAVLPQPYYKSDLQQSNSIYTNHSQQINSYYLAPTTNTLSNTSNYQNTNFNANYDYSTLQQYKTEQTTSATQIPVIQNLSVYPNIRMGLVINESANDKTLSSNDSCNMQTTRINQQTSPEKVENPKTNDDQLSEVSSTNFDFTIEAEKMVSALCDMKSPNNFKNNEPGRQPFEANENNWFLSSEDSSIHETSENKSVATQTHESDNSERLSELMRKTALWSCLEAEAVLKSARYCQDSKYAWLTNLSTATKTAIAKSSASFPVFGGDRILVHDLINALLRISNGWLALDNYLNKQYYPSLNDKYDTGLNHCFRSWENNTRDLLKSIVQTFQKIEKNTTLFEPEQKLETLNLSFPGDVSMYTRCDLFDPFVSHLAHQSTITSVGLSPVTQASCAGYFSLTPNFQYYNCLQNIKERTKWTITDNMSNAKKQENSRKPRLNSNCSSVSFQQSLNAEFCHLRNKVMESENVTNIKRNDMNKQKLEFLFENKSPFLTSNEESKTETNNPNPSFTFADVPYDQNTTQAEVQSNDEKNQINDDFLNDQYASKVLSRESEFLPKTKVTLLSQIEPSECSTKQQEMSAHLSAWFASMRNVTNESNQNEKFVRTNNNRSMDVGRNALDLSKQLKMDPNRQLLTLKNMQSIQSAPWNAFNLLNKSKKGQKGLEETVSAENLRVYMKPGSYNVPKKRHQKKSKGYQSILKNSSRVNKNSSLENSEVYDSPASLPSLSSVSNSPGNFNSNKQVILNSSKQSPNISLKEEEEEEEEIAQIGTAQDESKESTWKAACASAEILLEALNTGRCNEEQNKLCDTLDDPSAKKTCDEVEKVRPESSYGVFSSETSEDEMLCSKHNFVLEVESSKCQHMKINVKTDSWLIKTLKLKNNKEQEDANTGSMKAINNITPEIEQDSNYLIKEEKTNTIEPRQFTYSDMIRRELTKVPKTTVAKNRDVLLSKMSSSKMYDCIQKPVTKKNVKNCLEKREDKINKWSSNVDPEDEKKKRLDSFQMKKKRKTKLKDELLFLN